MSESNDWLNKAREVLDIELEAIRAVRDDLDEAFSSAMEEMSACTGRIVLTGVGKSGLIGRKVAATFSSTGSPAFFLHPVEGAHGDMGMLRSEDLVVAISNSGETEEVNSILQSIRSLGIRIVAMTSDTGSTMARLADVVIRIRVPREACSLGLAPTSSTTAVLAVGDAMAISLMQSKHFGKKDFQRYHPGGFLGKRLRQSIRRLMHTENLPLAKENENLEKSLEVMNRGGFGVVFITSADNRLTGVITDGDVRRMICGKNWQLSDPAGLHMISSPVHAQPDQSAASVLDLMEEKAITVLPIVDHEKNIKGLIHLHDLLGKGKLKFSS
ncbi:KpsF/GutQ family sugar-phosphate isomerase [Desulfonatronospira sp.]|uniref:KpsF/GutQ family sugar-phosphate isomerase n=1 Tax=Desulfonatronospira sp. TaxID=1962951 RepID=UPI0025C6987F|nr:KpsF/GutQ family sugar-phosphate isomerase [Desulfonatronospira sp.]